MLKTILNLSKLLIIILCLLSCEKKKSVDLFIWAGQSNAQGWMGDAKYYPTDPENLDQDILLNYTFFGKTSSNHQWIPMGPQKGRFSSGHFGPEVSFARELKKAGYNPAIFKYCLGGTGLARDWKLPGNGGLYDHMVKDLKPAIQKLKEQGYKINVRGFIWIQGETDAGDEKAAVDYQTNLMRMINDLRTEVLQDENLKIILGVDEQHSFVQKRPVVVEAQKKIAAADHNSCFTSMMGLPKADATHLTPEGLVEHGHIIYEAFKKMN